MTAYYNEYDKFAAAWLRELITDGLIATGDVDERSILDVRPDDLRGYDQCHFFAGIGGWSHALRLAGWPDDREVWTGSCPCQPFSVAGKQAGKADKERHLWPTFHALIAVCRPPVCFGEQVASKLGREWLSGVRADLEELGYAVGAADLCAAGVGAPHIRQRLWWMADANRRRREQRDEIVRPISKSDAHGVVYSGVADASDERWERRLSGRSDQERQDIDGHAGRGSADFWDGEYIPCADGKARRVEPGIQAHGIPNRVGILRGAGNAIVPQVAAEFVTAFMENKK
jgi:DNA (cytosine-5)-methyltransferase 1